MEMKYVALAYNWLCVVHSPHRTTLTPLHILKSIILTKLPSLEPPTEKRRLKLKSHKNVRS